MLHFHYSLHAVLWDAEGYHVDTRDFLNFHEAMKAHRRNVQRQACVLSRLETPKSTWLAERMGDGNWSFHVTPVPAWKKDWVQNAFSND